MGKLPPCLTPVSTCVIATKCLNVCVAYWVTRLGESVEMSMYVLLNAKIKICTDFLLFMWHPLQGPLVFSLLKPVWDLISTTVMGPVLHLCIGT